MEPSLLVMSALQASGSGGGPGPASFGGGTGPLFAVGLWSIVGIALAIIPIWLAWRGVRALERVATALEATEGQAATRAPGGGQAEVNINT